MKKVYGTYRTLSRNNLRVTGVPDGGRREEGGGKRLFKVVAENFPNLERHLHIQVREADESHQNFFSKAHKSV